MVTTVFEEKKKVQLSKNKSVVIEALETTSMGELESVPDTHKCPSPPPFPGTGDQGSVATEAHTSHGDTYQWGTNKVTETRINATEDKKTKQNKTDLSEIIIYSLIEPRQGNYT